MPTVHRRHAITETAEISQALDVARHAWPDLADKPGALLRRLILAGEEVLISREHEASRSRSDAIERTSGALTGVYGPTYLDDFRQDWPE